MNIAGDGGWVAVKLPKTLLVPIRVLFVPRKWRVLNPILLHSVALDELFILSLYSRVEIVNSYASFCRAEEIAGLVWEAAEAPCLVLAAALSLLLRTSHAPHIPHQEFPSCLGHHQCFHHPNTPVQLVRLAVNPDTWSPMVCVNLLIVRNRL